MSERNVVGITKEEENRKEDSNRANEAEIRLAEEARLRVGT